MISVHQAAREVERIAAKLQTTTIGKRETIHLCSIIQSLIAHIRDLETRSRQEHSYREAYGAMVDDWNGWVALMRSYGLFMTGDFAGNWNWEIVRDQTVLHSGTATSITEAYQQALPYMLKEDYCD